MRACAPTRVAVARWSPRGSAPRWWPRSRASTGWCCSRSRRRCARSPRSGPTCWPRVATGRWTRSSAAPRWKAGADASCACARCRACAPPRSWSGRVDCRGAGQAKLVAMPEAEVLARDTLKKLVDEVGRVIVGQQALVEGLLVGLLAGGHVLVEGVPGLAKTTAVRTLAHALGLGFRRVQFTPDLLPGDLLGTPVYHPDERRFAVRKGPIFAPVLLADEINRAPAKVQSALLEAMEERQVTIGDESFPVPRPFFVMATQNPIEHEGTYPLPEAQVDRFLLKLVVGYPGADDERSIAMRDDLDAPRVEAVADAATVAELQHAAAAVHVA